MGTVVSRIAELVQQRGSAWPQAVSFAAQLASNPWVQPGRRPIILRLGGKVLRASPLDPEWREYAEDLAAVWRANGLEVSVIEHLAKPTKPGTYVLTLRGETLALICTCQSWSDLVTNEPVWLISASVRPTEQRITSSTRAGPLRHLGVVTASTQEAVWQLVLDWLDSCESFEPDALDMLGPVMPAAEPSAKERTEAQSPGSWPRPLLLFGGASATVTMVALMFVIFGGDREPDQTAKSSSPLTGVGSSATTPNDHYGYVQDVRAAPAPSLPYALASDGLKRPEQNTPPMDVFEAREPHPDVLVGYAADSPAGSQSVNVSMLPTAETDPLPPPSPSLEASLLPAAMDQTEDTSAVSGTLLDVNVSRPAPEKARVSLATTPGPAGKRANQSSARRSPPMPRAKPSNPATSDLALVANAPPTEITSQNIVSAGNRTADVTENAATKPQNRPERPRRGPIPLTPIARPGYAVQVAAVTHPAAAPRVWSQTTARFPGLGDLHLLDPAPVEVGDKGRRLLYRVAAGTFEQREAAEATCNRVRARAGECLVIPY
jgi:hypothetical protein